MSTIAVNERSPRGRRRPLGPLAEALLIITVLSGFVALAHQLLTDDLCHGSCL